MSRAAQDTELIRRIAAGEEAALRALLAAHQTRVFRFVLRLVGNEAVAEEVMSEVFLEVWRNAARFEGASAPGTWILSIAHNRAVSRLRKRREETWDEDAAGSLQDEGEDRKSTRLNSSHSQISYAVFCLKKKKHRSTFNVHLEACEGAIQLYESQFLRMVGALDIGGTQVPRGIVYGDGPAILHPVGATAH